MKNDRKTLPVYLNRNQLASELSMSTRAAYRALEDGTVKPDAITAEGAPLILASRLLAIRQLLTKAEVLA
jgi:hypothetical protein